MKLSVRCICNIYGKSVRCLCFVTVPGMEFVFLFSKTVKRRAGEEITVYSCSNVIIGTCLMDVPQY